MGNRQDRSSKIEEELLKDYETLTFLTRREIIRLFEKFYSIGPRELALNFHHRFHRSLIMEKFPVLKFNPFRDRLIAVFSSKNDGCLSFEDMLDLASVMSDRCPLDVKAAWGFRIFDINDDMQINKDDIGNIIDRLVWDYENPSRVIGKEEKERISEQVLKEMKLNSDGTGIGAAEFKHGISKIPEFANAFYFNVA